MRELATIVAKRFIQRRDVYAEQWTNGWYPVVESKNGPYLPFKMPDLISHLNGERSLGHYLLDTNSQCKLFAFDIDLEKNNPVSGFTGQWVETPTDTLLDERTWITHQFDARDAWKDRAHPSRTFTKMQFRMLGELFAVTAKKELDLPVAISYSGNKGIHVYCFTGPIAAADAREGAQIVLDALGQFAPTRGNNFFRSIDPDPYTGFPNFSIEVFPKQDTIQADGLGNLMRLPFGKNKKSPDPCFLVDVMAPLTHLVPASNPIQLLESGNPWVN